METQLQRRLLIEQYRNYSNILDQKGLSTESIPDEELERLPLPDLSQVVRQRRDLARTPNS